ncbi:unnamed protein product [Mytilus coruscus]|uniref:Ig-like domain-containing protein n=1 Tax=Mytilus coruscus TaxID=42192 RepID=A0A6J8CWZ8_MYTCO|nr:unnamed protein product [Mytilus coruscus]
MVGTSFKLVYIVISCRDVKISESAAGLIGQNDTEIKCTFILEEGDIISSVSILAENLTNNQFQPIVASVKEHIAFLLPFGQILFENYTVEKTEKELLLVFDDLRCKHERQYRCSLKVFPPQSVLTTELSSEIMMMSAQVKPSKPKISFSKQLENLDSLSIIKDSSNNMDIKHQPVIFVEGENVTFNCSGNVGRPPGIILWQTILPEKQMPLFSNTSLDELPQLCSYNGISLLDLQVTAEVNQARIRCIVQSGISDDGLYAESERFNVYFKVKDPLITVHPDELLYEIGELIELQCKASGNPAPNYKWIKDSSSNETLTNNNTFVIHEANISDSGLYTCLVNNFVNDIVYSAAGSKYVEIVRYRWIYGKSAKLAVLITVISSSIMLIVATGCIIICRLKNSLTVPSQGNKYLDTVRPHNQALAKPEILAYEYASASFEGIEESRVTLEASNTFKQQTEKYKNDKQPTAISASVSDKETMVKSKSGDIRESLENHYASPVPEIYDKLGDRRHKPNLAEKFDTIVELKHLSEDKCVM